MQTAELRAQIFQQRKLAKAPRQSLPVNKSLARTVATNTLEGVPLRDRLDRGKATGYSQAVIVWEQVYASPVPHVLFVFLFFGCRQYSCAAARKRGFPVHRVNVRQR